MTVNTGNLPPGVETTPDEQNLAAPAAPEPTRLERALALERQHRAARETDDADPDADTVVEAVVEVEPPAENANKVPSLDELPALIEQRKQERLTAEQAEAERRELEALRAERAARETAQAPTAIADLPKYFESLKPAEKRDLLRALVQQVNATPAEKAIAPQLQAIDRKATAALTAHEQDLQRRVQAEEKARQDAFVELTGDSARWPSASLLDPEERLQLGYEIVAAYKEAGIREGVTDEIIAQELEKKAKPRIDRILAARRGTPDGTPAVPDARPAAPDSPASPDAPATLSNQHAATAPLRAPRTFEERRAAAMKLEKRHRSAREG